MNPLTLLFALTAIPPGPTPPSLDAQALLNALTIDDPIDPADLPEFDDAALRAMAAELTGPPPGRKERRAGGKSRPSSPPRWVSPQPGVWKHTTLPCYIYATKSRHYYWRRYDATGADYDWSPDTLSEIQRALVAGQRPRKSQEQA